MNTETDLTTYTVRVPRRVLFFLEGTDDYINPANRADDATAFYEADATDHGSRGMTMKLSIPAIRYLFEYADYMWSASEDDASWEAGARADRRASKQLMDTLRDLIGNEVYRRR